MRLYSPNYPVIPDLLKGDVVANDNIEYIKARNIKISSDSELESDVDGDKSDNLPVEIKGTGANILKSFQNRKRNSI